MAQFHIFSGVNHFFLSEEKFQYMIDNEELIEWSKVYKNFYGVPKSQIQKPKNDFRLFDLRLFLLVKSCVTEVKTPSANKLANDCSLEQTAPEQLSLQRGGCAKHLELYIIPQT